MYFPSQSEPFYFTLRFLQYSSYYPLPHKSGKWYQTTSVLLRIITSFVSIECALHCTMALKDRVPVGISEDIVGLTGVANCMLVGGLFQFQAQRWSACVRDIIDTKRFGTPPKMSSSVEKAERFAVLYAFYCGAGIVVDAIYSTIKETSCKKLNLEKGTHEICGMITPFWWPYHDINPLVKLLFNLYQLVSVLLILPPAAIVTFASWEANQIITAKIHHLNDLFSEVFKDQDFKLQKQQLKFCIQYHQHILKISAELCSVHIRVLGQSSFSSAIILSCIGSQILKEDSVIAVLHLMGYGLAVFLMCQTGQDMLDETSNIQHAVYASDWHLASCDVVKDIQLVLLRCQKPILMDSYLFGPFSYNMLIVTHVQQITHRITHWEGPFAKSGFTCHLSNMYQPGKTDAFYYSLFFMRYLHYYPLEADERGLRVYRTISAFIRILNSFVWIECVLHFSMALKDNIPVDISEDIVGFTGLANSMFLCIMFEINVKEWSQVFFDVANTSKFGVPPKMHHVIDRCNRFSWIYFVYCCSGILIYGIIMILDPGPCERWNAEYNIHDVCRTVTPLWWPQDDIKLGLKTIIVLCQLISCISYVPPSATLTYIIWEAGELILAKIHHLKKLFENAFEADKPEIRRARLRFCIQYHQEIIRLVEELNGAARKVCGQLSFVASIVFSCIGTQMLKEYSIHPMLHLIGYFMAVFLVCQTGQKIRDETYDIQDAVYRARWYEVSTSLAKDSQLIILRCQKPLCMDAIPFGTFNFNLLIVIIKTSYSYLTLINKTA